MRVGLALIVATATTIGIGAQGPDLTGYLPLTKAIVAAAPQRGEASPSYLGISVETVAGRLMIRQIDADSPAQWAGLKPGDVVLSIGDQPITSPSQLRDRLATYSSGQSVAIRTERDGSPATLNIRLGAPSKLLSRRGVLGVVLDEKDLPARVIDIAPDTSAARGGMIRDDVILKMDGTPTNTSGDVRRLLAERRPGDRVVFEVRRGDRTVQLPVELAAEVNEPTGWDNRVAKPFRQPVYRLGVVLVEFADMPFTNRSPRQAWEDAIFSRGKHVEKNATGQPVFGSVADYFHEMSGGKFRLEGRVFAPVATSYKRSEYGKAIGDKSLLLEVADKLERELGRGWIKPFDGLFVVYAGPRVATTRGYFFWPHRDLIDLGGERLSYFICPEGGERMTGIGMICHEFGHMLGLPDLYSMTGEGGAGVWCTMAIGHGDEGRPVQLGAWCKEQLGWVEPVTLDPRMKQKLIIAPREIAKVFARPDGTEYLLLENRRKQGFDRELPGEGLLIWRVVDGKPSLVEAHGRERDPKANPGVPFPSDANRSFTPLTTPSSHSVKPGGWPVHLTQIRRLPDGRIAFEIGFEYY